MLIRFLSRNKYKLTEAQAILKPFDINVQPIHTEIEELQTLDTKKLLRDKALKAFKQVGRPIFVEHTGLYLDLLNGFPGGLTQIFWDTLGKDKFSQLFSSEKEVTARTDVCYVDGRRVWHFEGSVTGKIVNPPRVDFGFQWDCLFQPHGHNKTFSEMGNKKNEISMRRQALEKLALSVTQNYDVR